ncbi:MAG: enoyl-CoA hydratase/isomerase family protein [Acidimicrobiia bacterium]
MDTLLVERDGGIVTVTLNKPEKKNAVDPTQWEELARIFDDIARNPRRDRAVVLTGAGGDFCSGADLWLPPGEEPPHQMTAMRSVARAIEGLHDLPQPTIAKVPGVAAGAGCSLALGCDLVVAAERARFSMIFAKRGLALDAGASWLLPRLMPLHKAKELAFFADLLSAEQAEDFGIVNRVVPDGELDAFVADWAARLAAGPPIALGLTKRLLNDSHSRSLAEALEAEGMAQSITLQSKDTAEAISSFMEKREPTFHGR